MAPNTRRSFFMHASYILGLLLVGAVRTAVRQLFFHSVTAILLESGVGLVVCYLQVYSFAGLQSSSFPVAGLI